jgi:hypothetical protein
LKKAKSLIKYGKRKFFNVLIAKKNIIISIIYGLIIKEIAGWLNMDDGIPCRAEIEKNLIRVKFGEPLTLPLATLNRSCQFKKIWDKFTEPEIKRAYHQRPEIKAKEKAYRQRPEIKAKIKAYMKAYHQRPEIKAKEKAYYQRPEIKAKIKAKKKAYMKAYHQRPEIKAKKKAYYQRPEIKAKIKAKKKAYYQRPEIKAKIKAKKKAYYLKKKMESLK